MKTYATIAELKSRLGITDTNDDAKLHSIIDAVSIAIEQYCGRFFYLSTETRYYQAEAGDWLAVDDLTTITALTTDEDGDRTYETSWTATTDYDLNPYNALLLEKPYTSITTSPSGKYAFPTHAKGVRIAGIFGWPSVPYPIREACLLWGERLFKRKDAPFGVAGSIEMGMMTLPPIDPDVQTLLAPYRKMSVGGV